jgi:hypothetical protein
MMAWMKNPRSKAASIFLVSMMFIFAATATGPLFPIVSEENTDTMRSLATVCVMSILLSETLLWMLAIVFPVERKLSFKPLSLAGAAILVIPVVAAVFGLIFTDLDLSDPDHVRIGEAARALVLGCAATTMILAMVLVLSVRSKSSEVQRRSGAIYLIGLWVVAVGGVLFAVGSFDGSSVGTQIEPLAKISLATGLALSGLIFAYSIASGQMVMTVSPATEASRSSEKASYRLLHRHVYLVEEEKPDFSFEIFADILKGRCFDCVNDDAFPCESLECSACKLPCPCRTCTKYKSRPQGMVVTRQYPNDVREEHFLQTTPIVWLSTVAGKDHMDPAKLNLLTDYLVNFMDRSHNGVVLVDGLEYLVTSNDFNKVLKAIDRWTESAMTSDCRLILSLDPRTFDQKELALLEKNKEVVRPDAKEKWQVIPERI